jgi:hypothetical protein
MYYVMYLFVIFIFFSHHFFHQEFQNKMVAYNRTVKHREVEISSVYGYVYV